jgi:hypothetical protein
LRASSVLHRAGVGEQVHADRERRDAAKLTIPAVPHDDDGANPPGCCVMPYANMPPNISAAPAIVVVRPVAKCGDGSLWPSAKR